MTLFTAEGLIRAFNGGAAGGAVDVPGVVHRAYLRWLVAQGISAVGKLPEGLCDGWLVGVRGLWARRAAGGTCLSALASGRMGTLAAPINHSKGCGGVMGAAPAGFITWGDAFTAGCEVAAITHGHPSGHLAGGVPAEVIPGLAAGAPLPEAVGGARERPRRWKGHEECLVALEAAVALAATGRATALEDVEKHACMAFPSGRLAGAGARRRPGRVGGAGRLPADRGAAGGRRHLALVHHRVDSLPSAAAPYGCGSGVRPTRRRRRGRSWWCRATARCPSTWSTPSSTARCSAPGGSPARPRSWWSSPASTRGRRAGRGGLNGAGLGRRAHPFRDRPRQTRILGVYKTLPAAESEFRYNFGFVETTGTIASGRGRAFDENGADQGFKDFQALRFSQRQVAL